MFEVRPRSFIERNSFMIFVVGCLLAAAIILIIVVRNQPLNGERIVHGYQPLKEETIKAEEICSSFDLPEGSKRLNTDISSKSYSGLVTNHYSTDLHCLDADLFFKQYLQNSGWSLREAERSSFLNLWPETRSEYSRENFSAYIYCQEMKDYRGIRHLKVACGWRE